MLFADARVPVYVSRPVETLASWIAAQGALDASDAVGWAVRLAKRIESLHVLGVAHGNISAECVLIEGASPLLRGVFGDVRRARTGRAYQSPERWRDGAISTADDVWAVAVTFYLALTGTLPFLAATEDELGRKVQAAAPVPLAVFDVGDDDLQGILDAVFAREPAARTSTVLAFRRALEHWQPGGRGHELPPLDEDDEPTFNGPNATVAQALAKLASKPAAPPAPKPSVVAKTTPPSARPPVAPRAAAAPKPIAAPSGPKRSPSPVTGSPATPLPPLPPPPPSSRTPTAPASSRAPAPAAPASSRAPAPAAPASSRAPAPPASSRAPAPPPSSLGSGSKPASPAAPLAPGAPFLRAPAPARAAAAPAPPVQPPAPRQRSSQDDDNAPTIPDGLSSARDLLIALREQQKGREASAVVMPAVASEVPPKSPALGATLPLQDFQLPARGGKSEPPKSEPPKKGAQGTAVMSARDEGAVMLGGASPSMPVARPSLPPPAPASPVLAAPEAAPESARLGEWGPLAIPAAGAAPEQPASRPSRAVGRAMAMLVVLCFLGVAATSYLLRVRHLQDPGVASSALVPSASSGAASVASGGVAGSAPSPSSAAPPSSSVASPNAVAATASSSAPAPSAVAAMASSSAAQSAAPPAAPPSAATAAPSSTGAGLPSAAPSPGTDASVAADPACVATMFAKGTFETAAASLPREFAFVCDGADPKKGAELMRRLVVNAGAGHVSDAMREWAVLGWYDMAAFAMVRGRCCAGAAPIALATSAGDCKLVEALTALSEATSKGLPSDEPSLDAALAPYTVAVECLIRSKYGDRFGKGTATIQGGEATAAKKMLVRASPR